MAADRRLRASMLVAAAIVAMLLGVMKFPAMRVPAPLFELVVEISRPRAAPGEESPLQDEVQDPASARTVAVEQTGLVAETESRSADKSAESATAPATVANVAEPPFDWEAAKTDAVRTAIDAMEKTDPVNPEFDRQRASAAIRFRASAAPVRKEIWENVEKDALGRTLLRKGDCYRVLDDPSAVNRWAFENFGQYITYCTNRRYVGRDLEWVKHSPTIRLPAQSHRQASGFS